MNIEWILISYFEVMANRVRGNSHQQQQREKKEVISAPIASRTW